MAVQVKVPEVDPEVVKAITEKVIADLKASGQLAQGLPEGAFYGGDGRLYHKIQTMSEGGKLVQSTRPLALTLEEAREKKADFFHPSLGWIWNGYKLAKDREPADIMADTTVGGATPPGEKSVMEVGFDPYAGSAHDNI